MGQRKSIKIFGDDYPTRDGTCVRDYIHVLDLAQAHILALRALDAGSRTYNLGNGEGFTVREVIEMAREITGHPIPAEVVARRPGDPAILIASSDKIRRELGWTPQLRRPALDFGERVDLALDPPGRLRRVEAWVEAGCAAVCQQGALQHRIIPMSDRHEKNISTQSRRESKETQRTATNRLIPGSCFSFAFLCVLRDFALRCSQ